MIQRQVGRNRVQPILDSGSKLTVFESMLLVQQVRRSLEDLKRPACTASLYTLTIYFYDTIIDSYTFQLPGDVKSGDAVTTPRFKQYSDTVESLFKPLETIAGVDVMAEASKIQPVPTAEPTSEPGKPITLNGDHGGVVLGPMDIPSGTYRVVLTGDTNLTVQTKQVTGSCTDKFLFVDSKGGSTEEIFTSDNCRTLSQVGSTDKPWTLEFKPVQ